MNGFYDFVESAALLATFAGLPAVAVGAWADRDPIGRVSFRADARQRMRLILIADQYGHLPRRSTPGSPIRALAGYPAGTVQNPSDPSPTPRLGAR